MPVRLPAGLFACVNGDARYHLQKGCCCRISILALLQKCCSPHFGCLGHQQILSSCQDGCLRSCCLLLSSSSCLAGSHCFQLRSLHT